MLKLEKSNKPKTTIFLKDEKKKKEKRRSLFVELKG